MKKPAVKITVIILAAIAAALLAFHITAVAVLMSEYEEETNGFQSFLRAETELTGLKLPEIFTKIKYRFTGKISYNGVENNGDLLFPTGDGYFDYKADAEGKLDFSEAERETILDQLRKRKQAHEEDGAEYFVFVIPNSQSVLKNELPFGDPSASSRLLKLNGYLEENGFDGLYILDGAFASAGYPVFHNTENAINEYGALLSFRYIVSKLPEQLGRRMNVIEPEEPITGYSAGRELARRVKLERVIKNENVYYDTARFESMYDKTVRSGLTFCTLKDEYNDFLGSSSVLVESYDKYELNLFRPLFAASFSLTCFKEDLSYSKNAVSEISPSAVVCLIREDRLNALLEEYDALTYNAKLDGEAAPEITKTPENISVVPLTPHTALIAGECEDNCVVTVTAGNETYTVRSAYGRFFAEVPAGYTESAVKISAKASGKATSEQVKATVKTTSGASCETGVGNTSMLYYTPTLRDYTGGNLFSERRLSYIRSGFEKYISDIRAKTGGNTKVIFLVAPDPLSVYPEAASEKYIGKRAGYTRIDQLAAALEGTDGLSFIDLRGIMRQNADIGKLFYQTDTHWTELGAYFGYRAVVSEIGADFPKVSPLPLNMFTAAESTVRAGDLASFAGLAGFTEKVSFLTPNAACKAVGAPEKPDTIDRSVYAPSFTSRTGNAAYPNALVIRDSYSANLFPILCEHFNTLYCQPMWDADTDYEKLAQIKADYVIIVCAERNLDTYLR
ncbi:MAG: hypothetical protein II777_00930 [Clostridia bacterium]|nr:hypothetical protein [Clostridia bacterium]